MRQCWNEGACSVRPAVRAPMVFLCQDAPTGPLVRPYAAAVQAGGGGGESTAAFESNLVQVEGSGESALAQVGVCQGQVRGVHSTYRDHPHPVFGAGSMLSSTTLPPLMDGAGSPLVNGVG